VCCEVGRGRAHLVLESVARLPHVNQRGLDIGESGLAILYLRLELFNFVLVVLNRLAKSLDLCLRVVHQLLPGRRQRAQRLDLFVDELVPLGH
jgi:hypothetical protein